MTDIKTMIRACAMVCATVTSAVVALATEVVSVEYRKNINPSILPTTKIIIMMHNLMLVIMSMLIIAKITTLCWGQKLRR